MKEILQSYIKEICNNCKNKETDLCEIREFTIDNCKIMKCVYYVRENKPEKKKHISYRRTAKIERAVMPNLITDWSRL